MSSSDIVSVVRETREESREESRESEPCMDRFLSYIVNVNMDRKQYQYDGVYWCNQNETRDAPMFGVRGGFIADEMGLGKTIMMIGTFITNPICHTLIVVPVILLTQWYGELLRTAGHKALIYHGARKSKTNHAQLFAAPIVLTTYGTVHSSPELQKIVWGRIVFDEAHHLRNKNTQLYRSCKALQTNIRWLVSGTPIQNRKQDFYALCSLLGLPTTFVMDTAQRSLLITNFILKRTKTQVGIKIPDLITTHNMVPWSSRGEEHLSDEIHSMLPWAGVHMPANEYGSYVDTIMDKSMGSVLPLYMRARQSCILPSMLQQDTNDPFYRDAFLSSSKLDFVLKTIIERKDNGNGKLVFCHFHEEMDYILTKLGELGLKCATFDGRTSASLKKEILTSQFDVILLQIQTGCEGLNLQQFYSEIYFVSPHWNPSIEDQAVARCHRIGQTKPVHVFHFQMYTGGAPPSAPHSTGTSAAPHSTEDEPIGMTETTARTITGGNPPVAPPTIDNPRTIDNYITLIQSNKRILIQTLTNGAL